MSEDKVLWSSSERINGRSASDVLFEIDQIRKEIEKLRRIDKEILDTRSDFCFLRKVKGGFRFGGSTRDEDLIYIEKKSVLGQSLIRYVREAVLPEIDRLYQELEKRINK